MSDFDFKKHSLERLEEWMCDAMNQSGASPREIYNTIINVVEEHVNYYQKGFEKTNQLLSLLKSKNNNKHSTWGEYYYPEEHHMPPWGHSDLEALANKKERWILKTEVYGLTGELFITLPDDLLEKAHLNEGDEVEWVNNLNGTFTIHKVTKSLEPDEC